jgi:hypothetical protein
MTQLILLFNHQLTPAQEADAIEHLGVEIFFYPSDEIRRLWSQIPPELTILSDYLRPVYTWLETQSAAGDFVLIQGDFGACYAMVQAAFRMNLIPIYATTRREAVENQLPDGSIQLTHQFRHVKYRKYADHSQENFI